MNIAAVVSLLADPTRATMLLALGDGQALPSTELARIARVSPSTASNHLTKLVAAGLLAVEVQGRHRYFRIADPVVVRALDALGGLATPVQPARRPERKEVKAIHFARTCYDHLAGVVGVALTGALIEQRLLTVEGEDYRLTQEGAERLQAFGIDLEALRRQRRVFARRCLDWSERRPHLAGSLGAALAHRCFEAGWIARAPSGRGIELTESGRQGLRETFGIEV